MRACLVVLLCTVAAVASGCAHVSEAPSTQWQANVASAPAEAEASRPATLTRDKGGDWQPIIPERGGPWSETIVTPVSARGPHAVAHQDGPYLLDSGDQLRIFVYGQPNLSRIYTVDHKGNIMMPLIGVVRAQRKSVYRLAGVIRARLGAKYIRDPQVTVDMHQNRPFFILGEVRNPGQYPYVNGMTVETAVAIAGGYSPRASERNFRISRRVDGVLEIDKGNRDYVVQPGDTIRVPERFF